MTKARELSELADIVAVENGNFNINSNALYVDANTNNVGIGTSSPGVPLNVLHDSGVDTYGFTVQAPSDAALSVYSTTFPSRAVLTTQNNITTLQARGGTSASQIVFEAGPLGSPVERMRIDSSGRVGIGTNAPAHNLVVSDGGETGFEISPSSAGNLVGLFVYDRNLSVYNTLRIDASEFQFRNGASEAMRITSSGGVGIGTSSLATGSALDVRGGNITTDSSFNFSASSSAPASQAFIYRPSDNTLAFGTDTTERLRIDSSGNVGIGTSDPKATFQIKNTSDNATLASVLPSLTLNHQSGVYTSGAYYNALGFAKANSNGATLGAIIAPEMGDTGNTTALVFGVADGGGTVAEAMRITSTGNVGIGTTASAERLRIRQSVNNTVSGIRIDETTNGTTYGALSATGGSEVTLTAGSAASDSVVLRFQTSSAGSESEAMRIDSSGRVGIGTTSPSSSSKLHVEGGAAEQVQIRVSQSDNTGVHLFSQSSSSGVWNQDNTSMLFATNNTEAMRIDSSGNVGIGTSSPASKLEVSTSGVTVVQISSGDSSSGYLFFGDTSDSNAGWVEYDHSVDAMVFRTNGTGEDMRIDSSGNLLVGTTTTDTATVPGIGIQADGQLFAGASNQQVATFSRQDSDGEIVRLRTGASTVGNIGNTGTNLYITCNNGAGLNLRTSVIAPADETGARTDNAIDLGDGNYRFKDLYLSSGVYFNGNTAASHLDDYEEGTFTPSLGTQYGFTAGTVAGAAGYYTKIGDVVNCHIRFQSFGSAEAVVAGNRFVVNGLPFATSNFTGGPLAGQVGSVHIYNSIGSGHNATGIVTLGGGSTASYVIINFAQGSIDYSDDVYITFTYKT